MWRNNYRLFTTDVPTSGFGGTVEGKGLSERSRHSWKNNINTDLKEIGY
jgi:hypothetical protein